MLYERACSLYVAQRRRRSFYNASIGSRTRTKHVCAIARVFRLAETTIIRSDVVWIFTSLSSRRLMIGGSARTAATFHNYSETSAEHCTSRTRLGPRQNANATRPSYFSVRSPYAIVCYYTQYTTPSGSVWFRRVVFTVPIKYCCPSGITMYFVSVLLVCGSQKSLRTVTLAHTCTRLRDEL